MILVAFLIAGICGGLYLSWVGLGILVVLMGFSLWSEHRRAQTIMDHIRTEDLALLYGAVIVGALLGVFYLTFETAVDTFWWMLWR